MRFPYRKINLKNPFSAKEFILRPIIPISLRFKDNKKLFFTGIGGESITGKIAEIAIELGSKKISAQAVFAEVGNGILGQYGFFDILPIKFDLKNKEVVIE